MSNKLNLSEEATAEISLLSSRLNLKRHTLCRLAMAISLVDDRETNYAKDTNGQEFNKSTIMGPDESIFLAMITEKKGITIDKDSAFNTDVRDHILRGLKLMSDEFAIVNSPTAFFKLLSSWPHTGMCTPANDLSIDFDNSEESDNALNDTQGHRTD